MCGAGGFGGRRSPWAKQEHTRVLSRSTGFRTVEAGAHGGAEQIRGCRACITSYQGMRRLYSARQDLLAHTTRLPLRANPQCSHTTHIRYPSHVTSTSPGITRVKIQRNSTTPQPEPQTLGAAREWKDKSNAVWTDGSRAGGVVWGRQWCGCRGSTNHDPKDPPPQPLPIFSSYMIPPTVAIQIITQRSRGITCHGIIVKRPVGYHGL